MPQGIEALRLFNEKAERLANTNFVRQILEHKKISLRLDLERGKEVKISRTIPNREAIEAFVLTFRFFIQNNERCSFGNLDGVYSNLPVSEEIKMQYRQARQTLNDYLNSKTPIKFGDEELSRRKIVDIFVYGGLAHANPQKKQLYDKWMSIGIFSDFLEFEFVSTLFEVLRIIRFVRNLNAKVIKELS